MQIKPNSKNMRLEAYFYMWSLRSLWYTPQLRMLIPVFGTPCFGLLSCLLASMHWSKALFKKTAAGSYIITPWPIRQPSFWHVQCRCVPVSIELAHSPGWLESESFAGRGTIQCKDPHYLGAMIQVVGWDQIRILLCNGSGTAGSQLAWDLMSSRSL